MKTAHEGLGITQAEWDTNMDFTESALKKFEVPEPERREFLSIFARYKEDIVAVPTGHSCRSTRDPMLHTLGTYLHLPRI
jgi:hypothetical protein